MSLNSILLGLSLFMRTHLLVRPLLSSSEFMSTWAQWVNYIFGSYTSYMFAVRSIQLSKPIKFLGFALLYSCTILAYMLWICEEPLSSEKNKGLGNYPNALWMTIVTMTTVGYGEISPNTTFGKVTAVATALWGALLTALFVVTAEWVLGQSRIEQKCYDLLENLELKDALRESAVKILIKTYRLNSSKTVRKRKKMRKSVRGELLNLKQITRPMIYSRSQNTSVGDQNMKEIRSLREDIGDSISMMKALMNRYNIMPWA